MPQSAFAGRRIRSLELFHAVATLNFGSVSVFSLQEVLFLYNDLIQSENATFPRGLPWTNYYSKLAKNLEEYLYSSLRGL